MGGLLPLLSLPSPAVNRGRLALGGESPGAVSRLSGRESTVSPFRGCSINLINGPITGGKHSSEMGSWKEEEVWADRF